jgi:hypothetical protein
MYTLGKSALLFKIYTISVCDRFQFEFDNPVKYSVIQTINNKKLLLNNLEYSYEVILLNN